MTGSHRKVLLTCVLCLGALSLQADEPGIRQWTDNTHRFQVEARLLDWNENVVRLERTKGSIVEVPRERLSEPDQEYVDQQPEPPKPELPVGVVTVALEENGKTSLRTALVVGSDQGPSYCLVHHLRTEPSPTSAAVVSGPKIETHISLEPLGLLPDEDILLLAFPKDVRPSALTCDRQARVRPGDPIRVVTLNTNPAADEPVWSWSETHAQWVGRGLEGDIDIITTELTDPRWLGAVTVTLRGEVLGHVTGARISQPRLLEISPLPSVQELVRPKMTSVKFAPTAGDRKTITCQLVARVFDPAGRVSEPRLLIKRMNDSDVMANRGLSWATTPLDDSSAVSLEIGEPEEIVTRQIQRVQNRFRGTPPGAIHVGAFSVPTPEIKPNRSLAIPLLVQFTWTDRLTGKTCYERASVVNYDSEYQVDATIQVPGFDGQSPR